jgi:hypothetical protein
MKYEEDFAAQHAAGAHQEEIVYLINKIEPHLEGHARGIILITLVRLIAVMLGPASPKSREEHIDAIPVTLRGILGKMDEIMGRAKR